MSSYKTTFMRGGTSKGCMFLRDDLPPDESQWDDIFLDIMGSPDPKQIDGLGGTVSSNNKIVVVWPSRDSRADVEYKVGQVIVGRRQIDWKSNCGNMTAAVGPFAVDAGLVEAREPTTLVRLLNRNTDKYINAQVATREGRYNPRGNCTIAGVDAPGSEIKVSFLDPAGAKTGKLLPTGNAVDMLDIPGLGSIQVTVLDVFNPMVWVRAEDIGLVGVEMPDAVNIDAALCDLLEGIRGAACCAVGLAASPEEARLSSPAVPKIGFFTGPQGYTCLDGKTVQAGEMDICVRVVSVFKLHKAVPLTSACALAVAARLPGSIVHRDFATPEGGLRIGHPSGIMTVYPQVEEAGGALNVPAVAVARTARVIMEGIVHVPE